MVLFVTHFSLGTLMSFDHIDISCVVIFALLLWIFIYLIFCGKLIKSNYYPKLWALSAKMTFMEASSSLTTGKLGSSSS